MNMESREMRAPTDGIPVGNFRNIYSDQESKSGVDCLARGTVGYSAISSKFLVSQFTHLGSKEFISAQKSGNYNSWP